MPKKHIEPTRWERLNGGSILVFDNLFTDELVEGLGRWMMALPYRKRPSFDNELSTEVSNEVFRSLPIVPELLDDLVARFAPRMSRRRRTQSLSHVYAAVMRHDDHTQIHQDVDCADCVTFLYYGNLHWEPGWGGETIFHDAAGDARAAVSPRPGRLALFNAAVRHRGGVPQRLAPAVRYGLSIFYRCAEMRALDASRVAAAAEGAR